MKIGICGGGPVDIKLDSTLDYIGVDHGVDTLSKQHIIPIYAIGDFDSIERKELLKQLSITTLPKIKDDTDMEAALLYAFDQGYDEIYLYGVTGGRLDHFMAVIALLQQFPHRNIHIIDSQNDISILESGSHSIKQDQYDYFSLFAFVDTLVSLDSCMYPLNQYLLKKDDPLCVSNQWLSKEVNITVDQNILFIRSKNK